MYPELIKSDIKLTIGMLVSNHKEYIRKAMEVLQPLLKAVPSELIVIDTKGAGTDGSIEIVREYTDKIYPFTWCNDFSAARNFCLEHARGEWFLYQDDDEWFDDVQEFIDFFTSGESETYFSGYYYTRDYHADGTYSMAIAGRMVRRTVNTRFVGRVHETFNEVFAPNKQFSTFTHHMGYAFVTTESRKQHQQRNLSILKEELKEQGYTPRICAQMLQEYLYVEDTAAEGMKFAKTAITEMEKTCGFSDSCAQWILSAMVRYYTNHGTYDELLVQAARIRENYVLSQMAAGVIAAVLVRIAGDQGDLETAIRNADIYIEIWDWIQMHPEEALLQTQMDFPRYYSEDKYFEIIYIAAVVENYRKNFHNALSYWNRLPWQRTEFDGKKFYSDMQITYAGIREEKQKKRKLLQDLKVTIVEASVVTAQLIKENHFLEMQEILETLKEATAATLLIWQQLHVGEKRVTGLLEEAYDFTVRCVDEKEQENINKFMEAVKKIFETISF